MTVDEVLAKIRNEPLDAAGLATLLASFGAQRFSEGWHEGWGRGYDDSLNDWGKVHDLWTNFELFRAILNTLELAQDELHPEDEDTILDLISDFRDCHYLRGVQDGRAAQ